MRTVINIILFFGLSFVTYGQDLTEIKASLEKIMIDENGSYNSDNWYYNPEIADIKEIKKETLKKALADYTLYSVFLEGFYSYHEKSSRCFVLLNSDNGELKIINLTVKKNFKNSSSNYKKFCSLGRNIIRVLKIPFLAKTKLLLTYTTPT